MTIKLFIAFSMFYLNTAIGTKNAVFPAPTSLLSHLFAAVPSCRQNRRDAEGQRRWKDVAGHWHSTSSQTLILHCAPSLLVSFVLGLQGCFWIITGYRLFFFQPASISKHPPPLFTLVLLFKVKQQNKSIANSLVQLSKLSISAWQCAYKAISHALVHVQAREPCINLKLGQSFLWRFLLVQVNWAD